MFLVVAEFAGFRAGGRLPFGRPLLFCIGRSQKWLHFWDQILASSLEPICLFWNLWQIIPAWLVLEAAGCEQSELSLLCCGSTSMIPDRLLHDGVSMSWHMLPSRLQDDATEQ